MTTVCSWLPWIIIAILTAATILAAVREIRERALDRRIYRQWPELKPDRRQRT